MVHEGVEEGDGDLPEEEYPQNDNGVLLQHDGVLIEDDDQQYLGQEDDGGPHELVGYVHEGVEEDGDIQGLGEPQEFVGHIHEGVEEEDGDLPDRGEPQEFVGHVHEGVEEEHGNLLDRGGPQDNGAEEQHEEEEEEEEQDPLLLHDEEEEGGHHDDEELDLSDSDSEVPEDVNDYMSILDNIKKQWLLTEISHHISKEASNSLWDIANAKFHELYVAKGNISRKIPKFGHLRKKLYIDNVPKIKMEFAYECKETGEITIIEEAETTPLSRFPRSTHRRLYEIASVDVSLKNNLTILLFDFISIFNI